jgi:hypothetical protein
MKHIITKIKKQKVSQFDVQELIKFFAENFESLTLSEEIMLKDYIRRGCELADIHPRDAQDVFNFFRKKAV